MSNLRLSHILCKVTDLHAAAARLAADGFTFAWGSAPSVAHNALVWFDEGPFLELFVPASLDAPAAGTSLSPAIAGRFRRWAAAPDGWCDVALESDAKDLDATLARLAAAGVAAAALPRMSRTNPDGSVVSWAGLCPVDDDLPFAVSAYSEPQRPARTAHNNGANRVEQVIVATPDPAGYRRRLAALLGDESAAAAWDIVEGPSFAVLGVRLRTNDGRTLERTESLISTDP